jgi:hypothetical protein
MFLFENVAVPPLLLYCKVNVLDPAVRPVITYIALACIVLPVRTSAIVSLALMVVLPDTATLMYPPLTDAVRITITLVPVVTVTDGLAPPPVRVAV